MKYLYRLRYREGIGGKSAGVGRRADRSRRPAPRPSSAAQHSPSARAVPRAVPRAAPEPPLRRHPGEGDVVRREIHALVLSALQQRQALHGAGQKDMGALCTAAGLSKPHPTAPLRLLATTPHPPAMPRPHLPRELCGQRFSRQHRRRRLLEQRVQAGARAAHRAVHHHYKVGLGGAAAAGAAGAREGTRHGQGGRGTARRDAMRPGHVTGAAAGTALRCGMRAAARAPASAAAHPQTAQQPAPTSTRPPTHPPRRLPSPMPRVMKKSKLSRCEGESGKERNKER